MMKIEGVLLEVQERAAQSAEGGRQARPAYAVAQILGEAVDFSGGVKKKLFDVAVDHSSLVNPFLNKRVAVPVDVYGTGKGTVSIRHVKGREIVQVGK